MRAPSTFDHAVVRVVPRVERGEFVNAGVIVFCRMRRYLAARIALDEARLLAIAPGIDLEPIRQHLAIIPRLCTGGRDSGAIGALSQGERFHWLVAPRSTIIQASPVHSGLCDDPEIALDRLIATMVLAPAPDAW